MSLNRTTIWIVYDGDCPICRPTANALKIRAAVGQLILINAREPHPILDEIKKAGINLDEGMVVRFDDAFYHGADALHVLAMIGTDQDWFNRINVWLFRSKIISRIIYPMMKATRSLVLKSKGISKINH